MNNNRIHKNIPLPVAAMPNSMSLEQAIGSRRSCREFLESPVKIDDLSLLLWSAQGITGSDGQKSAPSAGAQYPMEIYLAVANVSGLVTGTYQYSSHHHSLFQIDEKDSRTTLCEAALDQQPWVSDAAIVIVLTADLLSMQNHFREQPPRGLRGERYVYLESGAIAQNLQLQATSINLGAVIVGGFDDEAVASELNLPNSIKPTALICIGTRK